MHSWNNVRVENGIIEQKQFFIEQTNTLCNRSIYQTSYRSSIATNSPLVLLTQKLPAWL